MMTSKQEMKTVPRTEHCAVPGALLALPSYLLQFLSNHNGFLQRIYQRRPLPVNKRVLVLSRSQEYNVIFPFSHRREPLGNSLV